MLNANAVVIIEDHAEHCGFPEEIPFVLAMIVVCEPENIRLSTEPAPRIDTYLVDGQ